MVGVTGSLGDVQFHDAEKREVVDLGNGKFQAFTHILNPCLGAEVDVGLISISEFPSDVE